MVVPGQYVHHASIYPIYFNQSDGLLVDPPDWLKPSILRTLTMLLALVVVERRNQPSFAFKKNSRYHDFLILVGELGYDIEIVTDHYDSPDKILEVIINHCRIRQAEVNRWRQANGLKPVAIR